MMTPLLLVPLMALTPARAAPAFFDRDFVLKAPTTGPFAGGVNAPTIDIDEHTGTYVMYFESVTAPVSTDCVSSYVIGRATSPDGVSWTIDEAPVLSPDLESDTARCVVSQPAVVYDGERWHLFYSTAREKPSSGADYNLPTGISYATSTDGLTFTVQAEPLIAATDLSETIGLSSATIVYNEIYLIYYYNKDFRLSTSSLADPSSWSSPTTSVIDHTTLADWSENNVISPALFCEDDMPDGLSLVFAGDAPSQTDTERSLAFATSTGGVDWTMDAQTPLTGGDLNYAELNHWDVIEAHSDYLLWYGKTDPDSGLKAIGLATTSSPWEEAQPRLCPHDYQLHPPGDTGDDTSAATDDTASELTEKSGSCSCAAHPQPVPSLLGAVLGVMVLRRRRIG